MTIRYPETRTTDQRDDYHGTVVADPYRWLEEVDSAETRSWIEAQNRVTEEYLAAIPRRAAIRERLTRLWNFERYGVPFQEAGRYFYFRNDGLQNQAVLHVQDSLDGEPRVVLDPNELSSDGTVALTSLDLSRDGKLLAYGVSSGGSDWQEMRVRRVAEGETLEDELRWIKFSTPSWTEDARGFFYARYPEPGSGALTTANRDQRVYYHRAGTPQSEDSLVYARPDHPEWGFDTEVTRDGRYAVIGVWEGSDARTRVHYLDLEEAGEPRVDGEVVPLLDDFDAAYHFIGNEGSRFYFRTDSEAPRGRVIAIDLRAPERASWRTVIPETEETLQDARLAGGRVVASYLRDASSRLRVHETDGALVREIELPTLGSVAGMTARPDRDEIFYAFTSFVYPTTIFRHLVSTGETTVFRAPTVDFDPAPYLTEQLFYASRDGTRVPMFVSRRRDLALDGSAPALLYAYGGFNQAITPSFAVSRVAWLELGGVYAVANVRGGSEYGEEWHQAAMLERKQNGFDDFIAAAEHLVERAYTSPRRLAAQGGSNGGLLVGAVMNQRPELFRAALPAVGVMDMLRYHRFTIGWGWVPEYGSADDPEHFPFLHAYSPLHNLRPGECYPATLVTTGDHDDRVVPLHSFKYAAALQAAQGCDRPVLIRVETRAGHGAGKPTRMLIDEQTDLLAFLVRELGMG